MGEGQDWQLQRGSIGTLVLLGTQIEITGGPLVYLKAPAFTKAERPRDLPEVTWAGGHRPH